MIAGEKINLRLVRDENDIYNYLELYNNLAERAATDHTEIYSAATVLQSFQETGLWSAEKGVLLITSKSNRIIGSVSFVKTTDLELAIGYRIYQPKNRHQGYMSEALLLFAAYLFNTVPHITRLKIETAEENTASRRLAEKCGFRQEGLLRNAYYYRGKICNVTVYSLLRKDAPVFTNS